MKRIYYYFGAIAIICVLIIGTWVYVKYVRTASTATLTYTATRGSISEVVKSRGQLAAQHDFQLGFPAAGRVLRTYVAEGATVNSGTLLMRLDSTSEQARLTKLQADLAKLISGATGADIAVTQAQVDAARATLVNKIQDAYTTSDDAVRNQVDRFISSARSSEPHVDSALSAEPTLKSEIEQKRVVIETILNTWNTSVSSLTISSDLNAYVREARSNLDQIKFFLDRATFMVNSVFANASLTQTTLDSYKTAASTARTNVIAAISALNTADGDLRVAENQLALKQSPARAEDIAALQAQITEANQNIANTILRAPAAGTVVKFAFMAGEQYAPGATAVTFYSPDLKITADISELNIGRIHADAKSVVHIALDAFPDQIFTGKVVSVEPQEIDKDGDKYYRVNMVFDKTPDGARSGMSVDLDIIIQTKDNAVQIPEFLVYSRDGLKYVKRMVNGIPIEQQVTLGVSNGENVEILSGVTEGDNIAASTD
jgi:HlyD family secretion protein